MNQSIELRVTRCPRCGDLMQICADRTAPWDERKAINHKAGLWYIPSHGWCCELCKEDYLRVYENQQIRN